jgi:hypothetical protein
MADASALAGLLDRAGNVFSLARTLGHEFEQGFRERSPTNIIWEGEENPRQLHRGKINEFIAAVQGLRGETKKPPAGFAGVADVLRRAAETARLMATSPHWDPYESWPYLNQHAQDGYYAVKAARAAMPKDDPWDFVEDAPEVAETPATIDASAIIPTPEEIRAKIQSTREQIRHPNPSHSPNRIAADAHNDYASIVRMLEKRGVAAPPLPDHRLHPLQTINYVLIKLDDVKLALTRSMASPESESTKSRPNSVASFSGQALAGMFGGNSSSTWGNATTGVPVAPPTNPLSPVTHASEPEPAPTATMRQLQSETPKKKRSTQRGEAKAKLIAALTKYHQYADGGCLNFAPINNNELARLAGVSPGSASSFFRQQFRGYDQYRVQCRNETTLVSALKILNSEFTPAILAGGQLLSDGRRDHDNDD